jgi:Domain of unknown function (DUF4160)
MPTVLRIGPYRFFFYSNEEGEPPHIHVKGAGCEAKFWLEPITLAYNYGYRGHELGRLERLVSENRGLFLEAWNEYADRKQR